MKTIDKRAKECVRHLTQGWVLEAAGDQLEALFIAGSESERAEMTRWHDPKDLPERSRDVLLKLRYEADAEPSYTVGYWNGGYYGDVLGLDAKIIGWREIHE